MDGCRGRLGQYRRIVWQTFMIAGDLNGMDTITTPTTETMGAAQVAIRPAEDLTMIPTFRQCLSLHFTNFYLDWEAQTIWDKP